MVRRFIGIGAGIVATAVALTACGGGSTTPPGPPPVKIVAGINDHPRNPNAPNFAARQAAAHAKGLWLTDELNAPKNPIPLGPQKPALRNPNSCLVYNSTQRAAKTTCDSTNGFSADALSDNPPSWDTEIDFSDGTSIVTFEGGLDGSGNASVFTDNPDGSYTDFIFDSSNNLLTYGDNNPTPTPAPPTFCDQLQAAGESCLLPPPQWCPLLAGYAGLAAKYATLAAIKKGLVADAVGATIGYAVNQYCQSVQGAFKELRWNKPRSAIAYSPRFSSQS